MSEEFTSEQIRQVLDLELGDNDSGQPTVRGYLLRLLRDVWTEQEGFDGKRPFGNSSWDYDIKVPMLKAGLINGNLDSDGYVVDIDDTAAGALILAAIATLGAPQAPADEDAPGNEPAPVMHLMTIEMGAWCGAAGPGNGRASSQWREVTCPACTAKGIAWLRTLAWDMLQVLPASRKALAFALRAGRLGVTDEQGRPLTAACGAEAIADADQ